MDISKKWLISLGLRSNLPVEEQDSYVSYQSSLKFQPNKKHKFLLSAGRYHNYASPSYTTPVFRLLSAWQIALDYAFSYEGGQIQLAGYYKEEQGDVALSFEFEEDKRSIFGLEVYYQQNLGRYFNFTFSNTFLDIHLINKTERVRANNDLDYFIKASMSYNNYSLFSLSLSYIHRPGLYYTPISSSGFDDNLGVYTPIFGTTHSAQHENYRSLSLSASKMLNIRKLNLLFFLTLQNLLDFPNQQSPIYNEDYSSVESYQFYQRRNIYFGMIVTLP